MKLNFKILFIMILIYPSSYACERVVNEEFNFSYIYSKEKDTFSYKVERKDGKSFSYYKKYIYDLPIEIGMIIDENKQEIYPLTDVYTKFMSSEYNYSFSQYKDSKNTKNTTPTEESLISTDRIYNIVTLKKVVNLLKSSSESETFTNNKKIIFTIRTPLDSELKECISFKTQPLEYDFGSKYYWKFKRQFINIFYWE